MIGICTDSNAQLPHELVERYGIEVVPVTVRIGDDEYLEGVDLDADTFYARFEGAQRPDVSTSLPSPGQFALAYERLAERGATSIVSIHVGSALSGTLNSARLATRHSPVPVRLVDSGTASFGVGCCAWAAAEAVRHGATVDEAAAAAETLAPDIGNLFVVGALDLIQRGGRAGPVDVGGDEVPVLSLVDGELQVLGRAATLDDTVGLMADYALGWRRNGSPVPLKVAIGIADAAGAPLSERLEDLMRRAGHVREVVRYRVGPSVGAHTGPGTAGAFFFPA